MTATPPAVLDTDMLSEVMRDRDPHVLDSAKHYLAEHGRFTFSIITRYEILRGLKARDATRQVALFERQCAKSIVLPFGLFCDGNHVEDGGSVCHLANTHARQCKREGAWIGDVGAETT